MSCSFVGVTVFCAFLSLPAINVIAQQPVWTPELQPATSITAVTGSTISTPTAEDWGQLKVDPAALMPLSYAVLGTTDTPDFTRELLRVQWRVGDPIDLFVIKPKGAENPPVILYLYGYPSDTGIFWNDGWCKRATAGGFAAVGFVGALTGQRYNTRPMKQWFVSELQESLGKTTHDVQMVLNYLGGRGDLDAKQVGVFGQGSGGTVAILAAQIDPRIVAVDVLDPWGDWPDWLKSSPQIPDAERTAYLQPEFLQRAANLDPLRYLPHLKVKSLRVEQVMSEPVTPVVAKQKIGGAVSASQLLQYDDEAGHLKQWRVTGLSGWLRAQLRPSLACGHAGPGVACSTAPAAP